MSKTSRGANPQTALQEANDTLITLAPIMNAFDTLRNASPTFAFSRQFLEILEIAIQFIHAKRNCDWESHFTANTRILPYSVAADHPQYTRCPIQYLSDMQSLPQAFPDVHRRFMKGYFAMKITHTRFTATWSDQIGY